MLEKRVREWLQSQQPSARFVDDRLEASDDETLSVDFLVLGPSPLAIELKGNLRSRNIRIQAKRFLAQRIALAERFGAFVPFVTIVEEGGDVAEVPFADLTVTVSELPSLAELASRVRLNPQVQSILRRGEPDTVRFSSEPQIHANWEGVVTLEELADERLTFAKGSVAAELQSVLIPVRQRLEPAISPESNLYGSGSYSKSEGPSWWARSPRCSDAFDDALFKSIVDKCGGKVESIRTRDGLIHSAITRNIWRSPKGREVVLRRHQTADPMNSRCRRQELIAEAWMTRALLKAKPTAQVLLLGEIGTRLEVRETIGGVRVKRPIHNPPRIQDINALEAAGWEVAPWDFERIDPTLIKMLNEVEND